MASYNIYEKYLCGEPAFYLRDKIRVIADFFNLGNFGKGCLEKEKSAIRENQMSPVRNSILAGQTGEFLTG